MNFVIFVGRKMLSISDLMHTVYIIMNELCGHFSTVFGAWLACIPCSSFELDRGTYGAIELGKFLVFSKG